MTARNIGQAHCGVCRHFDRGAASLEQRLPGLAALSSAHGASRADDGFCVLHDRMLRASASCDQFELLDAPGLSPSV